MHLFLAVPSYLKYRIFNLLIIAAFQENPKDYEERMNNQLFNKILEPGECDKSIVEYLKDWKLP